MPASPLAALMGLDPAAVVKYGMRGARRRATRQQLLAAAGLPTDLRKLTAGQLHSFREGGSGMTKGLGFNFGEDSRPDDLDAVARVDYAGPHKGGPAGGRPAPDRTAMLVGGPKPAGAVPGRPATTPDAATLAELMRRLSAQFR